MKVSTLVFIGSLLATSLEQVHSDNNEVSKQHRKDEEVSINDIIGETPSGSIRASRRNDSDTEEDVEQSGEELSIRASRRNDRKKEGEKADVSDEDTKQKKKKRKQERGTDEGTDEEESNRRSGNKRGSDETGEKTSEQDGNNKKRGGRGGRNADKNDRFKEENNDEKRGGRDGGGGGGGRAGEEDTDQENKRKKNKRGNRVDGSTSGNQKKHSNEKKKKIKEGRKFRKRLDQENQQVTHSAGVPLVAPSEVVAEVPLPIEAEVDHEIMIESLMKAKSEKESVHQDAQMGMTPESAHTNDTLNTVTGDAISKKKQRYEKKDRRRNHPRPQEYPGSPPLHAVRGSDAASRFVVPAAAKMKQKTARKQRLSGGGKSDKMAP